MGTVKIEKYQLTELVYESEKSRVYKTLTPVDVAPTILKVLKTTEPSEAELVRFHREFLLTKQINSPYVIKVKGVVQTPETTALEVEDFNGQSLCKIIQRQRPNLLDSLGIAIDVAKGLAAVHNANMIHKDISPSNIVWNPETKVAKIIDFGNASSLKEHIKPVSANQLEGNLHYMSPEQTGRMNRPVDYRTDFYSFGITLYELFSGQLPFDGSSAHALIHCHIAKLAKELVDINPNIPAALSDIVLKLMAKNAEDRYRSAEGIEADLVEVKRQLVTEGCVRNFDVGSFDQSGVFIIPSKLYGRESDVEKLVAAFESVCADSGSLELTLVTGYSGVGKTSLVQELYRPMASAGGIYISGKYDQYQRDIPYSALANAFNQYCEQILAESEEGLSQVKQQILAAVGSSGQVLIDVFPKIERVIGKQPGVPKVDPQAAKNRFNQIFINFIHAICSPQSPVIVFLDDLQWMDQASFSLFRLLLCNTEIKGLHVVGAYRDNEVDASHPLHLLLDDLKSTGILFETIHLENLSKLNVSQLICQTLSQSSHECEQLVDIVYKKTMGNAFYATEFFKGLYADSLITYKCGKWHWRIKQLAQLDFTENVVDFVATKIAKYAPKSKQAISMAACIGNEFELETLRLITEATDVEKVMECLSPALKDGILVPMNSAYKKVGVVKVAGENVRFRFHHDRIQQAAYSLIPTQKLAQVHFQIGTILLAHLTDELLLEQKIFEVISHLNSGISCAKDDCNKLRIAELNYRAGLKALASSAYQAATQYFKFAQQLLPKTAFETCYDFAFKVHLELAKSLYINGEFEKSDKLYPVLLNKTKSETDQVEVRLVQMEDYHLQGDYERAIAVQRIGLSLLGETIPESCSEFEQQVALELAQTPKLLKQRSMVELLNAPEITSRSTLTRLRLLVGMWMSAYLVSKDNIVQWCSIRMTNLTLKEGNSEYASFAYVQYGYINVLRLNQPSCGYEFGNLAIKLADRYDNIAMQGKVYFNFAIFINHWTQHISTSTELFRKAYLLSIEGGDWTYAVYGAANIISNLLIEGKPCKEIENEANQYVEFLRGKADIGLECFFMTGGYGPLMNLIGKTERPDSFSCAHFDESALMERVGDLPIVEAWLYSAKLRSLYHYRLIAQAYPLVDKSKVVFEGVPAQIKVPEAYFYSCLIIAARYSGESISSVSERDAEHFTQYATYFASWAKECPQNFLHKYHLIEAEWSRINGQSIKQTLTHFNLAIDAAEKHGYQNNLALALELKGRFWLDIGEEGAANASLQEAYAKYKNWGVFGKVTQLSKEFPALEQPVNKSHQITPSSKITRTLSSDKLDLETLYKASNAISSVVTWRELIDSMLRIVLESTGANRGILLIQQNDTWKVEAMAEVNQQSNQLEIDFHKEKASSKAAYPTSVIDYVTNTESHLHLDSDALEEAHSRDPYFNDRDSFSVLCHFIPMKSRMKAIMYLENTLLAGGFSADRQILLSTLLTQIGISLENARLYQEIEIELATQVEKLAQSNLELEQFAYVASHDLQAPLRHVTAYVEMLLNENPTPEEKEKWMGFVVKGAEKMKQLIDDLLTYSRVTKQKSFTMVDAAKIMNEVIDTFSSEIKQAGASIAISPLPKLLAVDFALRQTFQNLIGNALKFRKKNVPLEISIKAVEQDDCWQFTIQDNGIGIDAKYQDRIFQVFRRLHTSSEYEGTGIGLSICKKVVEFHSGKIWVESEVDKGTKFSFTIAKKHSQQETNDLTKKVTKNGTN